MGEDLGGVYCCLLVSIGFRTWAKNTETADCCGYLRIAADDGEALDVFSDFLSAFRFPNFRFPFPPPAGVKMTVTRLQLNVSGLILRFQTVTNGCL